MYGDESVRNSYRAWITPGDLIAKIISDARFQRPDFESVMSNFLQKELLEDQYSKLEQAGYSPENRISLEKVFVDLPSFPERRAESPEETEDLPPGFLSHILQIGTTRLNESEIDSVVFSGIIGEENEVPEPGRYVLVGGTGQGKSTLANSCVKYTGHPF